MTSTTTKPGDQTKAFEFFIRRTFKAPRERVWKAWTEAEQFGQWWGPKDFDIVSVTLDLRPGGMAHYLLRSPEGEDMWGRLLFREIVPQERLVFIVRHPLHEGWPLHIFQTVRFTDAGAGKTEITIRWVPYEATEAERKVFEDGKVSMTAGWTGTFDRLDSYLARA